MMLSVVQFLTESVPLEMCHNCSNPPTPRSVCFLELGGQTVPLGCHLVIDKRLMSSTYDFHFAVWKNLAPGCMKHLEWPPAHSEILVVRPASTVLIRGLVQKARRPEALLSTMRILRLARVPSNCSFQPYKIPKVM